MNILITGANGQLGNEMRVLSAQHTQHTYFFTDIAELDITSREAVNQFVTDNAIDVIVNCAAYTNVDKAETDEDMAHKINALAVENLGLSGAKVIHVSTDYVFSGEACVPYSETDSVAPRTAYGRTKREGEVLLQAVSPKAVIIRTAWLYSTFGNNFVKTMLRLGQEREALGVVFDQIGSPTYAADLAVAIFAVINAPVWQAGVYHFTNEGVCSWYDFTHEIFARAKTLLPTDAAQSIAQCNLRPILSSEYQYQTPRPHFSVLNKSKIKSTFGIAIPHWTEALQVCLEKLLKE
ncbi:MAG: dTDP-4-dehydrorhamnose reductase [Paludibacteraceae bacterium]|nr:dTDP-4-dehydrorhamnose reductase [Paludibacteraceae bacterium]